MVCSIMVVFCMFLMALTSTFLGWAQCFGCRPFWIQQDHGVNVLILLVATTLEVCEGVCQILWCLCSSKESLSSPSWYFLTIVILKTPWFLISMDFITDLPPSNSYDFILVTVDHLTKMAHFIPSTKIITNEGRTKLFLDHVFQYHGLPKYIIFNHGP